MALIEINTNPTRKTLRWYALFWFPAFFVVVGLMIVWKSADLRRPVLWLWSAVGLISLTGYIFSPFMRIIYLGMLYALLPIGFVLGHIILAVIFYGVFTPLGLALRLVRGDPLERALDRSAVSYWKPRGPAPPVERYFKQF